MKKMCNVQIIAHRRVIAATKNVLAWMDITVLIAHLTLSVTIIVVLVKVLLLLAPVAMTDFYWT